MKKFLNKKENIYNIKNSIITKPIECGGLRTKNIFKKNTKSKPLITIITVVKNDNKNIIRTIKSVINQPYKNIEYIIIDGKSNDGTLEKIKSYENKIDFWVSKKDNNLWEALNLGVKFARGDIIGILNSKDFFYKDSIGIISKYFINNKIDFLFGTVKKKKVFYKFEPDKIYYRFNIYPSHSCSFFIKKSVQKKVGLYNSSYDYCSDYDYFYRLIVQKKMIGKSTKKNEVIGEFDLNGISSAVPFYKTYFYEMKIRYDNGQNIIFLFFLFIIKIINKIRNIIFND